MAHTTDPWTCPPKAPQGHHPQKIPMKDHPHTPSLDICVAPFYLFWGCMWIFGSRQAVLFIVGGEQLSPCLWLGDGGMALLLHRPVVLLFGDLHFPFSPCSGKHS